MVSEPEPDSGDEAYHADGKAYDEQANSDTEEEGANSSIALVIVCTICILDLHAKTVSNGKSMLSDNQERFWLP